MMLLLLLLVLVMRIAASRVAARMQTTEIIGALSVVHGKGKGRDRTEMLPEGVVER